MTFNKIPGNASVFIDANILVYYFTPDPTFGPECKVLMDGICKYQDFYAYTSTHVVSEMAHQLMILEAVRVLGRQPAGITGYLRQHPAEVQRLKQFLQTIDEVPRLGIEVLPIEPHLPPSAAALSQLHGLLTNDALILATMQDQSLTHLVSHDTDFDRVPGITRYAPV
jgi:predicted nucleic acid-binding protein